MPTSFDRTCLFTDGSIVIKIVFIVKDTGEIPSQLLQNACDCTSDELTEEKRAAHRESS